FVLAGRQRGDAIASQIIGRTLASHAGFHVGDGQLRARHRGARGIGDQPSHVRCRGGWPKRHQRGQRKQKDDARCIPGKHSYHVDGHQYNIARHTGRYDLEMIRRAALAALMASLYAISAQTPANVLVVVNQSSEISRRIADYYTKKRAIPAENFCRLHVTDTEEIDWSTYSNQIEEPIAACLKQGKRQESILYVVTTLGVPLRVRGNGENQATETCAVDSELTLLYAKMRG